jgi:hypothetical protein
MPRRRISSHAGIDGDRYRQHVLVVLSGRRIGAKCGTPSTVIISRRWMWIAIMTLHGVMTVQ